MPQDSKIEEVGSGVIGVSNSIILTKKIQSLQFATIKISIVINLSALIPTFNGYN